MAVRLLGKKGIFLTFISIAIIAAAIVIFTPSDINIKKDLSVVKTRVSKVNEYVLDLENVYLERTLQATGRKTIIALIKYMEAETISTGTEVFLTDFNTDFSQVLLDGTIQDPPLPIDSFYTGEIMTGNTFRDWLGKVINTAFNTFNVNTNIGVEVDNIQVFQLKPWFVEVEADISFNVSSETASWNKTATIKTEIEIQGFDDPYYIVKSLQDSGVKYVNKIRRSGTKFDEWNVEEVKDFIREDGNYTHFENSNAPSFIMRFTDDISASPCCGIESFVNPNNPAISDRNVNYADHSYWSDTPTCPSSTLYTVFGLTGPEFPDCPSISHNSPPKPT